MPEAHNTLPNLEKAGLDPSDVKSYRPISNLTFLSKLIERVVSQQLISFLDSHDLMPAHQSAYRKYHSTETVILGVL